MWAWIFGISGSRIINFYKISNERSDFKMDHMSELLSELAHFGIWWVPIIGFLKNARKSRFPTFCTPDKLQKRLPPMGISVAFSRPGTHSVPKSPEICFFLLYRKMKRFIPFTFQNERIPTESRSCGVKWNLSAPRKSSSSSHISSNFSWKCAGKCGFSCFLL